MYTIKDLEHFTGIQAHTIRTWEHRYGILNPGRTETNMRRYSERELRKLLNIALLNKDGVKISTIANMTDEEIQQRAVAYSQALLNTDEGKELQRILLQMDEEGFINFFQEGIKNDIEQFLTETCIPFFMHAQVMWQTLTTGRIHVHFIMGIYKQLLLAEINKLPVPPKHNIPLILFLPLTEEVDVGLLTLQYLARVRGYYTLYIAGGIPAEEFKSILQTFPEARLLSTATLTRDDLNAYYKKVLSYCTKQHRLILIGQQMHVLRISDSRLSTWATYTEARAAMNQILN